MSTMFLAIDQALKTPQTKYSKKEAQELLQKYGVLTKQNTITTAYRGIVVKAAQDHDRT